MLPNFTQDELRLIERMADTYAIKKRRNINALLKRFGKDTDLKRIRNMDNAAIMALHIKTKARSIRLGKHHEIKASAIAQTTK